MRNPKIMGDFVRDWRRWSGAERATALIITALFPIVASALLIMALEPVDPLHSLVSIKVEAPGG
jgi:hypothetical protein